MLQEYPFINEDNDKKDQTDCADHIRLGAAFFGRQDKQIIDLTCSVLDEDRFTTFDTTDYSISLSHITCMGLIVLGRNNCVLRPTLFYHIQTLSDENLWNNELNAHVAISDTHSESAFLFTNIAAYNAVTNDGEVVNTDRLTRAAEALARDKANWVKQKLNESSAPKTARLINIVPINPYPKYANITILTGPNGISLWRGICMQNYFTFDELNQMSIQ